MTTTTTAAHNAARLTGTLAYLDTGADAASIHIYGGTRPATPLDAPASAALVQIALTQPCGTITAGVLTLTQAADGLITTTGTATWARILNGAGEAALDCDAGVGAGAWELQLPQAQLFAGGDCKITSAALT